MVILTAFLTDCILGDPHVGCHPVRLMGSLISFLESLLRKLFPKSSRGEFTAGCVMTVITASVSAGTVLLLLFALSKLNWYLETAADIFLCYTFLAAGSLRRESMKVCRALEAGDTEKARQAVSMIVGRDTAALDASGIVRAAVETVAENTSDGVIAPMIFMAIGGAPLGAFYKSVNTMDSMVGYKNEKYLFFGRAPAKLDDVLNFIPARISGLLLILSAGLLGIFDRHYDMKNAWRIFRRDRYKHASPNSAQTEAAAAGALHLRLAGDAWYFGELYRKQYIGDDDREIEAADITRMNRLMYTASTLCLVICVLIIEAAGRC